MILNGKTLRDTIATKLEQQVRTLQTAPTLVIIQVGDKAESSTYIKQKKLFGEKIGVKVVHAQFAETVTQHELTAEIDRLNQDQTVTGILVQLPLPAHLHAQPIIDTIAPAKDVDGLTATNTKKLMYGEKGIVPATTRGIITLLKTNNITIDGKKVVIIGRSNLVGKPTALAMLGENATVTVCHKHTVRIAAEARQADILIVAAGAPGLITEEYTNPDQVIIDVGITAVETTNAAGEKTRKIVGDVDFEHLQYQVKAITPVPGGVGPMTVVSLFENLVEAAQNK
jgi:methylenetetrahydrofolate dehydrogenase (NADP+)/methenyltetrahydrofolate cyclohydrolase